MNILPLQGCSADHLARVWVLWHCALPAGQQSVLALNSCLLPVAALHGAHVITAAGLGSSRRGFHEVQRRLAGFHASQCGFCTPGMAVATHAALMAAAQRNQQQQDGAGVTAVAAVAACSQEQQQNGNTRSSCNGKGGCASSTAQNGCRNKLSSSSGCAPSAAELLSALDGNLCRCTGWRPIADAAKSFCSDVDIEDLGLCSISKQQLGPLTSPQQLLPAALQGPLPPLDAAAQQLQPGSQQQQMQFEAALTRIRPGCVLMPTSLQQLLAAVAAAAVAGVPVHLMGGNTGAGIYKQQWQAAAKSVCTLVQHVPEMQQLTVQQGGSAAVAGIAGSSGSMLLAGAGVTISQLLSCLKGLEAAEQAAGRQLGARNVQFLCSHISRIAGTLVRNAATLGGHLALARSQQLESDLLPVLIAAGEPWLCWVQGSVRLRMCTTLHPCHVSEAGMR
jgi:xanthine dehydrogenase iron-sulfur cluster and FAD-binding subunit A